MKLWHTHTYILCSACETPMSVPNKPLSTDCGGVCWACTSEAEADAYGVSVTKYRRNPEKAKADFEKKQGRK